MGRAAISHFWPCHVKSYISASESGLHQKDRARIGAVEERQCQDEALQRPLVPEVRKGGGGQINSKHTLWLRALVIDYPANCSCLLSICNIHLSDSAATCDCVKTHTVCTSLPIAYHNLLPGTSRETVGQNVFLSHGNAAALKIWMCCKQEASGYIINRLSADTVAQLGC